MVLLKNQYKVKPIFVQKIFKKNKSKFDRYRAFTSPMADIKLWKQKYM
jgi:hypothetical protein